MRQTMIRRNPGAHLPQRFVGGPVLQDRRVCIMVSVAEILDRAADHPACLRGILRACRR
jgi:hypothetical protein